MAEKTMYFANFNITFGKEFEPMLKHFEDVIYPAFLSELTRGEVSDNEEDKTSQDNQGPVFSIKNVKLKKSPDGDIVLVGNYVKDTMYKVRTNIKEGQLVQSPLDVPTAPYSRFIIFLRNHRMVLIKNETNSPDIRSFQATVRTIFTKYRKQENSKESNAKKSKLPYASVNIVDMKLKEDINRVIDKLREINKVSLRFFPLNGDNDPQPLANAIRKDMMGMMCNTANMNFNSPQNKNGVKEFLEETTSTGMAISTIKAIDGEGQPVKIKEDNFTSSKNIDFNKDIDDKDDNFLINFAKKNESMNKTSEENNKLYKLFVNVFEMFMKI